MEIDNYPRPRAFLDSIGNNSIRTRKNYETGLVHLQRFLFNRFNGEHNVDSIIDLILHNQMNVYELLDNFVSYEALEARGKSIESKLSEKDFTLQQKSDIFSPFGIAVVNAAPNNNSASTTITNNATNDAYYAMKNRTSLAIGLMRSEQKA